MRSRQISALVVIAVLVPATAFGQEEADLAKKLANPVASLISVPIQANHDSNIGLAEEGSVWRINVQPVFPFAISDSWNLISRTIVPIIDQQDIPIVGTGESGIGDVVQSFFFSPAAPTSSGLVWAVGPVLLIPTASDETLGAEKWGVGPTLLVLKQQGHWTYGALTNHVQSIAGESDRADVSLTLLQPFLNYVTKSKTTFGLGMESTYDWENEAWSVPINATIAQMLKVGSQIIQITVGARYWADSPVGGPQDWGARVQLTLLYPKR